MFGKGKRNDNFFVSLYASIHARLRWLEDTAAVIGRIGLRRYPSHRDVDIEEDLDTRKPSRLQDKGKRFRSAPVKGQNGTHIVGEHEAPRLGQVTS